MNLEKLDKRFKQKNTFYLKGDFKIIGLTEDFKKVYVGDKYGVCLISIHHILYSNTTSSIYNAVDKTSYWINMAKEIHGDRYDYSLVEYKGGQTKVKIICPLHGVFEQSPVNHGTQGYGCNKCGLVASANKRKYSKEKVLEDLCEVHDNKYTYDLSNYTNIMGKINITCPVHGVFKQTAMQHKTGNGCPKCAWDLNSYRLEDWSKMCPGNPGIFYILKCWDDDEEFYKVGITCNSIPRRYSGPIQMPYKFKVIKKVVDYDRKIVWDLEKHYLKVLKDYHYVPKIPFQGGMYECIKIN